MSAIQKEKDLQKLKRMLVASIDSVMTEEDIRIALDHLKPMFPGLSEADFDRLFDEIACLIDVSMDTGIIIENEGHVPWLEARRSEIEWRRWNAYNQLLVNEGRLPVVIDKLDQTLDVILDHLGDPSDETQWSRRGLVIGDVQSGKTGTYIGLIDKAMDAGYRFFILLTGNTESLRQQTQSRVDQGVLGRDSMQISRTNLDKSGAQAIGVGKFLKTTSDIISMTTMTSDFGKKSSESVAISAGSGTAFLFVTKKNKSVLNRISAWLGTQAANNGQLTAPLLLIDDESDYASINTRSEDEDPTAINAGIIKLLSHFSRSTYVGFTATPFANIFIDDDRDEDLFPKDFIYGLEAPSNYVGAAKIFGDDGDESQTIIHSLQDAEKFFPTRHKSQFIVQEIPESLRKAIQCFLLANAVRDLRGQYSSARSMLINVSRFIKVQEQVFKIVTEEFADLRNAIRLHAALYLKGIPNRQIDELRDVFKEEFGHIEYSWEEVLTELPNSISTIDTRLANSKTDKKLEQDELSLDSPPRLIAIGGDLLSRGLTLDGLMVSYFYRTTAAADTLMQMGRWFGYREGYEDICRLWITPEMASNYAFVADALNELRLELVRMRNQKLTPEQYGLAVRNHPGTLLITARNKMRAAKVGQKNISLRGRSIESAKLSQSREVNQSNFEAARELISVANEVATERTTKPNIWRSVPKEHIAAFLDKFTAHESMGPFQPHALGRFAKNATADDLQTWDVVLMSGLGDEVNFGPIKVKATRRAIGDGADGSWLVSDQKARVAGRGDVAIPLSKALRDKVDEEFKTANPNKSYTNDRLYVYKLERPALFLYPIQRKTYSGATNDPGGSTLIAAKIAIPGTQDGLQDSTERDEVKYTLNSVAQKFWFPEYGDDSEDIDD